VLNDKGIGESIFRSRHIGGLYYTTRLRLLRKAFVTR